MHEYVVKEDAARLTALAASLQGQLAAGRKTGDYSAVVASLKEIESCLKKRRPCPRRTFFRMGYYLEFSGKPLPQMPVEELNAFLGEYLDREFMRDFIADARRG